VLLRRIVYCTCPRITRGRLLRYEVVTDILVQTDSLVASSIFGDCASAIVVGSVPRAGETSLFEIHRTIAVTVPDSRDMITWNLRSNGWIVGLSPKIPSAISSNVPAFVAELLSGTGLRPSDCTWPIHPGGVNIITGVELACGLTPKHTQACRNILRKLGNCSSATVLCCFDETRQHPTAEWAVSLAFGPGICIEGALLRISDAVRKRSTQS